MSEVKSRPNIFLTAIGWLFLVIVSFVISRPSLLFPISFIPVITILLCYSLTKIKKILKNLTIFKK